MIVVKCRKSGIFCHVKLMKPTSIIGLSIKQEIQVNYSDIVII